jgi:hypothetical protein
VTHQGDAVRDLLFDVGADTVGLRARRQHRREAGKRQSTTSRYLFGQLRAPRCPWPSYRCPAGWRDGLASAQVDRHRPPKLWLWGWSVSSVAESLLLLPIIVLPTQVEVRLLWPLLGSTGFTPASLLVALRLASLLTAERCWSLARSSSARSSESLPIRRSPRERPTSRFE